MSINKRYDFQVLTNEAERLVLEELERRLDKVDDPRLHKEDNVIDMAAFALNLVRPMYRANLLGRLYADALDKQTKEEIRDAVEKAVERIGRNPS